MSKLDTWKAIYGRHHIHKAETFRTKAGQVLKLATPVYYLFQDNLMTLLGTEAHPVSKTCATTHFDGDGSMEVEMRSCGFLKGAEEVATELPAKTLLKLDQEKKG